MTTLPLSMSRIQHHPRITHPENLRTILGLTLGWYQFDTSKSLDRSHLEEPEMEDTFKLVPEPIPSISKSTVYERVLDEFLAGPDASARVMIPKKKPSTVHQGLLKVSRSDPRFSSITVVRRGESTYLKK